MYAILFLLGVLKLNKMVLLKMSGSVAVFSEKHRFTFESATASRVGLDDFLVSTKDC